MPSSAARVSSNADTVLLRWVPARVGDRAGRGWGGSGGGGVGDLVDEPQFAGLQLDGGGLVEPLHPDRFEAGRLGELCVGEAASGVGGGAFGEGLQVAVVDPAGVAGLSLGRVQVAGDDGAVDRPLVADAARAGLAAAAVVAPPGGHLGQREDYEPDFLTHLRLA